MGQAAGRHLTDLRRARSTAKIFLAVTFSVRACRSRRGSFVVLMKGDTDAFHDDGQGRRKGGPAQPRAGDGNWAAGAGDVEGRSAVGARRTDAERRRREAA